MAKKKKKTAPLSRLDKAIYGAVKVLLIIQQVKQNKH